jgi:NADPH2:quinone reductase
MQAIIADPSAPAALRLADVPEPVAGPSQVLLEVHHASLNHGDLNDARSGRVAAGGLLGSDAAGVGCRPRPMAAGQRRAPAWSP